MEWVRPFALRKKNLNSARRGKASEEGGERSLEGEPKSPTVEGHYRKGIMPSSEKGGKKGILQKRSLSLLRKEQTRGARKRRSNSANLRKRKGKKRKRHKF